MFCYKGVNNPNIIHHNIILYSLVLECTIKNLIIINLQSIDDWQLLNHSKQWTTIISTIKDNWTQQLQQSHNGNNAINIIQHAFPFLSFFLACHMQQILKSFISWWSFNYSSTSCSSYNYFITGYFIRDQLLRYWLRFWDQLLRYWLRFWDRLLRFWLVFS